MTTAGSSDGFRGVFEGSITGSHFEVTRRPYHKNCACALHNNSRSSSSSSSSLTSSSSRRCPHHKPRKVSYPIKRSYSEGSFSLYPTPSSLNPSLSPSSSSLSDLVSKGTHHPPLIPRASSSSNINFFISGNQDV